MCTGNAQKKYCEDKSAFIDCHYYACHSEHGRTARQLRLRVASGMHRFYLQEGAELEVVGGSPQVYAEKNAKVILTRGTPRVDYGHPDILDRKDKHALSITTHCELSFKTSDVSSCLYVSPVIIDTIELIPAIDTLAVMATLLSDPTVLTSKKNASNGKKGAEDMMTYHERLPNNAIVIHQDSTLTAIKKSFLLTRGETEIHGEKNKIYVQKGTTTKVSGESNTVYALKGSAIHINGSEENTVHFETGALVVVEGNDRVFRLIEHSSLVLD